MHLREDVLDAKHPPFVWLREIRFAFDLPTGTATKRLQSWNVPCRYIPGLCALVKHTTKKNPVDLF